MNLLPAVLWAWIPFLQATSEKITVAISGVPDEETARPLREALVKVPGIKVKADDIQASDEPDKLKNRFTGTFVIEFEDLSKVDLGAVAKVVAETKVKERTPRGPWLNLILFNPLLRLREEEVVALRTAMADVNGVDAQSAGGTGGFAADYMLWVRLDGSGGAKLKEIQAALRKDDLDFRLKK